MKKNYRSYLTISVLGLLFLLVGCDSTRPSVSLSVSPQINAVSEVELLKNQGEQIIIEAKKAGVKKKQFNTDDTIKEKDELDIQVWMRNRITQFSGFPLTKIVPASGEIFIPNVGLTRVAGKTDNDIKNLLSSYFNKILKNPTVVVEHRQIIIPGTQKQSVQSVRHVTIMGWVYRPGIYILDHGLSLRSIIAQAGGMKDFANKRKVYLVRGSIDDPIIMKVNMQKVLIGKDLGKNNIILEPNDAIYIPPIGTWKAYDVIRKALLPIRGVVDTISIGAVPVK